MLLEVGGKGGTPSSIPSVHTTQSCRGGVGLGTQEDVCLLT